MLDDNLVINYESTSHSLLDSDIILSTCYQDLTHREIVYPRFS